MTINLDPPNDPTVQIGPRYSFPFGRRGTRRELHVRVKANLKARIAAQDDVDLGGPASRPRGPQQPASSALPRPPSVPYQPPDLPIPRPESTAVRELALLASPNAIYRPSKPFLCVCAHFPFRSSHDILAIRVSTLHKSFP